MHRHVAMLIVVLFCGCAAEEKAAPNTIRQRFVPSCEPKACKTCGGGACWTALVPAPGDDGALWVRAHAGIGDQFPVREEGGPTLFEVHVIEGSDDRFLLEIRSAAVQQRIDLARDKTVSLRLSGHTYEFYYPSVHVNATAPPTRSKALLIITRRPQAAAAPRRD